MGETPPQLLARLFMVLARTNPEAIHLEMGSDIAIVDEISRRWLRGTEVVAAQIRAVLAGTAGLSRRIKHIHTQLLGPKAVVVAGCLN
jgi:hypothetical protein